MDQLDNHHSTAENHLLEMMKQHIGNGLPFHYTTNCKNFIEIYYTKLFVKLRFGSNFSTKY
jgi:hypothetical protein